MTFCKGYNVVNFAVVKVANGEKHVPSNFVVRASFLGEGFHLPKCFSTNGNPKPRHVINLFKKIPAEGIVSSIPRVIKVFSHEFVQIACDSSTKAFYASVPFTDSRSTSKIPANAGPCAFLLEEYNKASERSH